jgi:uncharacterized membrane protein
MSEDAIGILSSAAEAGSITGAVAVVTLGVLTVLLKRKRLSITCPSCGDKSLGECECNDVESATEATPATNSTEDII